MENGQKGRSELIIDSNKPMFYALDHFEATDDTEATPEDQLEQTRRHLAMTSQTGFNLRGHVGSESHHDTPALASYPAEY